VAVRFVKVRVLLTKSFVRVEAGYLPL